MRNNAIHGRRTCAKSLERVMRFELTTFSLATKCSTPELHPHMVIVFMFGGDNRDRTDDLLNANQSLSQLSYIPKKVKAVLRLAGRPVSWAPSAQLFNQWNRTLKLV
jgi:hypothetical protein